MKRVLRILALFLLLAALAAAALWWDFRRYLGAPLPIDDPKGRQVIVEQGSSAGDVVDMLQAEGIVDHPLYFRAHLWHSGQAARLQPGVYAVPQGTTAEELAELLTRGGLSTEVVLKVYPGANLYELAQRLHEQGIADAQAFLRRATDPQYAAELGVPARTLEGYLLAGTYVFERGVSVDQIIAELHARFRDTWRELRKTHAARFEQLRERYRMGDHELLTLASIVEREAVVDRELPIIARVFFNRLDKSMRLQSDPTCVYPPRVAGERPSPQRCHDPQNPYSTYVIQGLPPGPIGAPAPASMAAVLEPYRGERASELLYFVARNDGSWTHYFSSTYAEHQHGVEYFLRKTRKDPPRGTRQP